MAFRPRRGASEYVGEIAGSMHDAANDGFSHIAKELTCTDITARHAIGILGRDRRSGIREIIIRNRSAAGEVTRGDRSAHLLILPPTVAKDCGAPALALPGGSLFCNGRRDLTLRNSRHFPGAKLLMIVAF